MRELTASVRIVVIGLVVAAASVTSQASSQATPSSNPIVHVYSLIYIDAKAGAATVQALVKGSQAYPADAHTVVVITPDPGRQKVASDILLKLDRPLSTSQVQDVERLSTDSLLPEALKNVAAITQLRYPEVHITEEDSSASLLFQGPDTTTMKAYCFAQWLTSQGPDAVVTRTRCIARKKTVPVPLTANLTATTYTVRHAVPYGLP
jgi:hypothetical protein